MITPYPPPVRVEMLRVRRVDPTLPVEYSRLAPWRDPGDVALHLPARIDRVEISDEARRLLKHDVSGHAG